MERHRKAFWQGVRDGLLLFTFSASVGAFVTYALLKGFYG